MASAPRTVWKGFMKLGAVTCAVKMLGAASEAGKLHFRILNRRDRLPVKSAYIDEQTGGVVPPEEQTKGYELDSNEYLIVEPDELKALKVHTEHTLDITGFVEKTAIDPVYLDTPYYLVPGDKGAAEAFAVVREAMRRQRCVGLSCVVLYQRTHHVMIEPAGKGMTMTTLRYQREVVDDGTAFEGLADVKVDKEMADIASMIIDKKVTTFDPSKFVDTYEDALIAMIQAKLKGRKPPKPVPPPKENVVNLMDVLKKSLVREQGRPEKKRTPATARKSAA